jgi:hypothetical protein
MKAKDLADILLKHPDYDVRVGIQRYLPRCREYSYEHVYLTNELIDIDDEYGEIWLGKEYE